MSESEFDQAASATAQTLSGADFLDRVVGHANGCPIVCACPMVWWRPLLGRPTRMRRDSLGWLVDLAVRLAGSGRFSACNLSGRAPGR